MFTISNNNLFDFDYIQTFAQALVIIAILLTFYCLIIIPAKIQFRQISFVIDKLKPGAKITTHNDIDGTVILVLSKTVVIEQKDGCKVEILKQSIKVLNEQN